jgi:hypothetical protein
MNTHDIKNLTTEEYAPTIMAFPDAIRDLKRYLIALRQIAYLDEFLDADAARHMMEIARTALGDAD